jgi:hypothetical protein
MVDVMEGKSGGSLRLLVGKLEAEERMLGLGEQKRVMRCLKLGGEM